MDQFRNKSGYICDMDGVIYHGNRLLPGAKEFVEWLYREKKKFLFLTNNSGKTPRELQDKLARMGLEVDEQHFYTSALATAEFIAAQMPGAKAYVIGEPGLYNALYDRGITLSDINPDYVVMGESPNYNYDAICKAVHLVQKGARFIGCNSDLTGPTEEGLVPSCRARSLPTGGCVPGSSPTTYSFLPKCCQFGQPRQLSLLEFHLDAEAEVVVVRPHSPVRGGRRPRR